LHPAERSKIGGIGADRGRGLGIVFDEAAEGRAARERFEAERSAAGEQVGDAQALE
jgi:hypothetical protein